MNKKIKNLQDYDEVFYSIILESDQADDVLGLIKKNVNLVIDFFDLDGGAIFLLENKNANLFLNFNLLPSFVKNFNCVKNDSFIFKEIFRHTSPFIAVGKIKRIFEEAGVVYKTIVIVPIFYGKKTIGFYVVASNKEKNFAQRDVKLMSLIGKEIGSFIDSVISDVSIKKEKQNFKSFFNSFQDIIIVANSDGFVLELNDFASKKLKYERNYFLRKKIADFLILENGQKIEKNFFQLFNEKFTIFLSMRAGNGSIVPVEMTAIKGIWDEKEAYFFTAKDLSKTKETEQKLKENQDLYTSLVSNVPNYILIYNKSGKIVYANNSIVSALNYNQNHILKKNIFDIISGDSRNVFEEKIKNNFLENNHDCEIKLVPKNKKIINVIVHGASVKYAQEDAFLLVMTDITNRKKIEDLLIERTSDLEDSQKSLVNVLEDVEEEKNRTMILAQDLEKFRLAVENASDHIVITDSEGILLYANNGVGEITGFSPDDIVGTKCGSRKTWGGLMDKDFYKKLWHTIKIEKKSYSGEILNKKKDGSTYVAMVNISPILNEKGDVLFFVGIERDITREKEIDKAKSEFVSLASHQLRTPLSIINWYTEMLSGGDAGQLNETQKDYLNEIIIGNKRMVDLVGALLNVSRIEMGTFAINPIKSNLIKISKEIVDDLLIKAKLKNINFDCKYGKNIPLVSVDPKLFSIVIDNLVSNAIKYTPDFGKITFKINKEVDGVLITISDSGYGILKKDKDKIFTKLFRGENAKEKEADGNGLGLYIAKSIVEQSNGKIWFESKENKGTIFYVLLPFSGMKKKKGTKELAK
ncbi:MAG: PAS domain S-box protein [Candidatus Paceibacterota bacterium]|jgi:PAS domain S-box-containing protein|nr:PAS domain S-box protein [bacterium]